MYSIFWVNEYHEASAINRFKARLALCPFFRNLPVCSSRFGLHRLIMPAMFKSSMAIASDLWTILLATSH